MLTTSNTLPEHSLKDVFGTNELAFTNRQSILIEVSKEM